MTTESPIQKAEKSDLSEIQRLLSTYFLDMEDLKPEDFVVYKIKGKMVGCAALIELESKLKSELGLKPELESESERKKFLEIHSIAVHPNFRGKKIGTELVKYLLKNTKQEAEEIAKYQTCCVYVRTSCPGFFEKLKFKPIDNSEKVSIWEDCKKCEYLKKCVEHAMKYCTDEDRK